MGFAINLVSLSLRYLKILSLSSASYKLSIYVLVETARIALTYARFVPNISLEKIPKDENNETIYVKNKSKFVTSKPLSIRNTETNPTSLLTLVTFTKIYPLEKSLYSQLILTETIEIQLIFLKKRGKYFRLIKKRSRKLLLNQSSISILIIKVKIEKLQHENYFYFK